MAFGDTFDHETHTRLWNNGLFDEAEAYRNKFSVKGAKKDVIVDAGKDEEKVRLNKLYTKKFGKVLRGGRSDNLEWIEKKLAE